MRRVLAAALLLAAPLVARAQRAAAPSTAAAPAIRIDYVADSLPNGLHVIYHVDHSAPLAAVMLWYNVGSKNEVGGRTGFAHLFEHMMFKGSRNVADGQHWALLESAGGRAGVDINGTTDFDRTNYFETVPSNQLELALWLESDRMGTLTDVLTQEKLDNQREVVKNERRQSVDNQPYGTWYERMMAALFPVEHPYHHSVIGSMTDLSAATVADVQGFFRTYYAPNNAVLVVAGDIDVPQAKALVRKHFGWIPRGPAKPALADMTLPPTVGAEQRQVVEDPLARTPAVYVAFRVPALTDTAWSPAVSLLGSVLADGKSARLYESLVREKQLATQVFGGNFELAQGADVLFFAAIGKPGQSPDSLERALLAELDRARDGVSHAELDRVRAQARFQLINGLQTMGGFGGRADRLAMGWTFFHDPDWVNTILRRYDAVTMQQVHDLAAERLVPMNRITLVYVPKAPAAATPAAPVNAQKTQGGN